MLPLTEEIRKYDYYRYLCCLLAPDYVRGNIITIYAFNNEIAKIAHIITEPMAGHIRLQWWRDAIEEIYDGKPVRHNHEVVHALYEMISEFDIDKSLFDSLIDAREADIEFTTPPNIESLANYSVATSSNLFNLLFAILGLNSEHAKEAAYYGGISYAITGIMRGMKHNAYHNKIMLPQDLMNKARISAEDVIEGKGLEKAKGITKNLCDKAMVNLQHARQLKNDLPKDAKTILLPLSIISPFIKRIRRNDYDLFNSDLEANRLAIQISIIKAKLLGSF